MDKWHRVRLARHYRSVIAAHEQSLKELKPGTDYYEMVLGAKTDTEQMLEHLMRQDEGEL